MKEGRPWQLQGALSVCAVNGYYGVGRVVAPFAEGCRSDLTS